MSDVRRWVIGLAATLPLFTLACGPMLKGVPKRKVTTLPKPDEPKPGQVEVEYVPESKESEGTVVVAVTNATSKVSLVTSMERGALNVEGEGAVAGGTLEGVKLQTKLLCSKTPCAVTLPVGSQTLHIEAPGRSDSMSTTDLYDVDVLPRAQMVTHVMSKRMSTTKPTKGLVADLLLETLGWSLVAVSPIGFATDNAGLGGGLLGGGLLMVFLGYWMYDPGGTESVYTPHASTLSPFPPE